MNALILGTVDFLRDPEVGLSLSAEQCDEQPDGQPPPTVGEVYYSVHEGDWSNRAEECLDESFGCEVTITLRTSHLPKDRLAVHAKRRLRTMAAELRAKVHGSDLVRLQWNRHLNTAVEQEFVEPLRFRSAGKILPRAADWFSAEDQLGGIPPSGLSITLSFGGARRIQALDGPMT